MQKIKNIFILGGFTLITGAVNYATYPILLHHLSLDDFATFSVYSYIITLLAIPASGFGYFILIRARNHPQELKKNIHRWMTLIGKYSILSILLALITLLLLSWILDLHSFGATFLIATLTGSFLIGTFYNAVLQSQEKFFLLGLFGLCVALSRLFLSGFVIVFPDILVAVSSLVLSGMLGSLLFYFSGKRTLLSISQKNTPENIQYTDHSIWNAVIVIGLLIFLQSIDVIIVKFLFLTRDVALYAAVSVITKFWLVIIGILETVYLPSLIDSSKNVHKGRTIFYLSLLSLFGCIFSYFGLPILGELVFSFVRPELQGAGDLFMHLGIATVALAFFIIFLKSLMLSMRYIGIYILTVVGACIFIVLSTSMDDFSRRYMISMVSLYMIIFFHVIIHLYKEKK